jgi:hypothetical protein
MKKIYNNIDEVILRTNNHRLRQEFGEVGTSQVFPQEGTSTIYYQSGYKRNKFYNS